MESLTFGRMVELGWVAAFWCAVPGPHRGQFHISGEEGVERFGPDVTPGEIRRRLRCECCGHRGERILVDVWKPTRKAAGLMWSSKVPRIEW